MVRVLKKKTVKKVNVKLQKLRESGLNVTLVEDYVTDTTDKGDNSINYENNTIEQLKEESILISKLQVAIDFVSNPDKLTTRYCFYSNKFTRSYNGISRDKSDNSIICHSKGTLDFYPNQEINTATLSISNDTIFYNLNTYKLTFKKHLYLSKSKPKGFAFDFNTGKLKLYPNTTLADLSKENKKAFRIMLDTLGLEFITDEIVALEWLNRIGLEKAIKYSITTGKEVIKEKLRYSSLEYTEHTASLLYKSFIFGSKEDYNKEDEIINSALVSKRFKEPYISYHSFVSLFHNCSNIDAYLTSWNNYVDNVEKRFVQWKGTLEVFPLDSEYKTRTAFLNFFEKSFESSDINYDKLYAPLLIVKNDDFMDTQSQCNKLGKKINLSWSESRLSSFHDELTWEIMKIESETLYDENYYHENNLGGNSDKESTDTSIYFDGLELITTRRRLYHEGAIQHHCIFTNYETRVKRAQYMVFSMVNKENKRITIGCAIERINNDENSDTSYSISIDQMRLKRNDMVSKEDGEYIRKTIESNSFQSRVISYIGLQSKKETFIEKINSNLLDRLNRDIEDNVWGQAVVRDFNNLPF